MADKSVSWSRSGGIVADKVLARSASGGKLWRNRFTIKHVVSFEKVFSL
jgi:hypothetical protein